MVFKYFSQQDVPLAGMKSSQYLNAFCLCILVRYYLVHEIPCVDPRILQAVKNLGRGSSIIIILAETLNGLDIVHRWEATFFGTLIFYRLHFDFQPIEAPYIFFAYTFIFSLFLFCFYLSFFH